MNQVYQWLAELPPSARQSWSALAVAVAALVGFGFTAPFAGKPLFELNALFPSLDAIVFVTELITSALLFAQFSIWFTRALCLSEWILIHGANRDPPCAHIRGRVLADRPFRCRDPDRVMALYLLARRFCRGPISLRASEEKRPL
jgi:hypothetical protein